MAAGGRMGTRVSVTDPRCSALMAVLMSSGLATGQTDWVRRLPTNSPPPRYSHSTAFDSQRGRTVLFGGTDLSLLPMGDTWEWDGSQWTQRIAAPSPPARYAHAAAYDRARGRTLVF